MAKKYSKFNFEKENARNSLLLQNYYKGMTEENYEQLTKEEIETIILNIFKNPATKLFSYNNSETLLLSKKDTPSFYTEKKKTNVNLNSKTNIR